MGIEPTENSLQKTTVSTQGSAKSGAVALQNPSIDPNLAQIIEAWSDLPEAVRAGIVALVKASIPTTRK